jgi:hypothetical protein
MIQNFSDVIIGAEEEVNGLAKACYISSIKFGPHIRRILDTPSISGANRQFAPYHASGCCDLQRIPLSFTQRILTVVLKSVRRERFLTHQIRYREVYNFIGS